MLKLYHTLLPGKEPFVPEKLLSIYRREKLKKQKNALIRRQSLFSELLLRFALQDSGFSAETPLDLKTGDYGKPFLRLDGCFFNLSHSADAVICALSDREIGADVQMKAMLQPAVIKRCFSEEEKAFIRAAADPDDAFTEIWVKKESFCKLKGRGLSLSPASFSVFDKEIAPLLWHETAGEYHLAVCSSDVPSAQIEVIKVETDALL